MSAEPEIPPELQWLSYLTGPNITGESEQRTRQRLKTVDQHDLFSQTIELQISYRANYLAKALPVPKRPLSVVVYGYFSYPKDRLTPDEAVDARRPDDPLVVDFGQIVDTVRPPVVGEPGPQGASSDRRSGSSSGPVATDGGSGDLRGAGLSMIMSSLDTIIGADRA